MRAWLEETLSKHSNRTPEQVNKDIDRDKILSAEEALEYGLIDQVLTSRKRLPAALQDSVRRHRVSTTPSSGSPERTAARLGCGVCPERNLGGFRHRRAASRRDDTGSG